MKTVIILSVLLVSLFQCDRDLDKSCADKLISVLKTEEVRNPPAEIWEYEVEGKKYYYVTSYCCDMFSDLYDDSCTLICHPDGGITGTGDGKCGELKEKLIEGKLIWKDDRK